MPGSLLCQPRRPQLRAVVAARLQNDRGNVEGAKFSFSTAAGVKIPALQSNLDVFQYITLTVRTSTNTNSKPIPNPPSRILPAIPVPVTAPARNASAITPTSEETIRPQTTRYLCKPRRKGGIRVPPTAVWDLRNREQVPLRARPNL